MSLAEVTRRTKRSPIFRHPLFSHGEVDDPEEPGRPFVKMMPLPELEQAWHFQRNCVPPWIRLLTGRAARQRTLEALRDEYAMAPADRYRLIDESLKCAAYSVSDPWSWDSPFLCAVRIPTPEPIPIWWWGGRDAALTIPLIRGWYYHEGAQVYHGAAALEIVQREWNRCDGDRR